MAKNATNEGVLAVDRALKVLNSYREGDAPLTLAELSKRTGFYKSGLLKLLASLEKGGLVSRMPDKRYAIGGKVMRLSAIYQRMFRLEDYLRPVLRQLVAQTGESASFYRREGSHRVCLFRENSAHGLRDHVVEGDLAPINKGASSHVLTQFDEIHCSHIPQGLLSSLPILSFEETHKGTSGAAVPVFGNHGRILGALTISGPLTRLTRERLIRLKPILMAASREASGALGAPVTY